MNPKIENINSDFSKIMLSKLITKFIDADEALNEYNIRRYLQIGFYEAFNAIQEFRKYAENESEFYAVVNIILPDWLKLLSLTIPHICEELWEYYGMEGFVSNTIWGDFNKKYINQDLEKEYDYISNVIEDIINIKKVLEVKNNDKIYIYTSQKWKMDVNRIILSKNGEFKSIMSELKKDNYIMKIKPLVPFVKNQIKNRIWEKDIIEIDEYNLLLKFKPYMEKNVNQSIIINSENDPTNKASKAIPFKPAIYIGN